jgi:hypothetical protein
MKSTKKGSRWRRKDKPDIDTDAGGYDSDRKYLGNYGSSTSDNSKSKTRKEKLQTLQVLPLIVLVFIYSTIHHPPYIYNNRIR